ncbi:MAG: hypothetical protein RRA15_09835 [bacterium]|nr:hypothetical protein [bacterium]
MSHQKGHSWTPLIAIFIALVFALGAAISAGISYCTWQEEREVNRAYIFPIEAHIKPYEDPRAFGQKHYFLMGEGKKIQPVKKTQAPDFPVIALDVVLKNIGNHPAGDLGYSIIAIPINRNNQFGPPTVANYGPQLNNLYGTAISDSKSFAWRAGSAIGEHRIILAIEYIDEILRNSYCELYVYNWLGGSESSFHGGFEHISTEQSSLLLDYLTGLSQVEKNKVQFGLWNCKSKFIDSFERFTLGKLRLYKPI